MKPSPLALLVLTLLAERPMHPYEMQRVYHWRGKSEVINVLRGSLYPVVERLVTAGLIAPVETGREGRRPERTVYELLPEGRETAVDWLLDMLSSQRNEYPEFPAALAFLPLISSDQALTQLSRRAIELKAKVAALEAVGNDLAERFELPRIFGIEDEYRLAMLRAELAWVDGLIGDLSSGEFGWDAERIAAWAAAIERKVGEMPGGTRSSGPS
jgi:DNA-binding PadR family transcriptional regulator